MLSLPNILTLSRIFAVPLLAFFLWWPEWRAGYLIGFVLYCIIAITDFFDALAIVLLGVVAGASLLGAAWTLWERRRHDPWLRLLRHARQRLRAAGIASDDTTPPRTLAQRLQARDAGDAATQAVIDWLLRLEAQRYARTAADDLRQLQRAFRQLDWPARPDA